MKKYILLVLIIVLIIVLLTVFFTSCFKKNDDETSSFSSVASESESGNSDFEEDKKESDLKQEQLDETTSLFTEKIKTLLIDLKNIEYVKEIIVNDETCYIYRVVSKDDGMVYLVNADLKKFYMQMRKQDNIFGIEMYNAYNIIDDNEFPELTSEEEYKLIDSSSKKIKEEEMEESVIIAEGIKIISQEYCFLLSATQSREKQEIHLGSYAISLDGERMYKLSSDGMFLPFGN